MLDGAGDPVEAENRFRSAHLLTGDDRYLDGWRKQLDAVNAHKKVGLSLGPRLGDGEVTPGLLR